MAQRIRVPKIPAAVVAYIVDRISDGTLAPGEKLAPQRQLARELGIGLSSLREALHSLETLGLVEVKRGKGTFITRSTRQAAVKGLRWGLATPSPRLGELLEIRGVLESELAALAAERATEKNIRDLEGLLSNIQKAILRNDRPSLDELDVRFHITIAEAAQNSTAAHLLVALYDLVADLLAQIPYTNEQFDRHCEVGDAIRRRDPEGARIAVQALIEAAYRAAQLGREEPPDA